MTDVNRWRRVGIALAVGSAYDLGFGVLILAWTRPAASLLGLSVPADPIYLHLNGVLLLLLAGLYGAAATDPARYRAVAPIAGGGRLLGFVFMLRVFSLGNERAFLWLGVSDLLLGLLTLLLWWRADALSD